jgi:hypothetical protein
MTPCAGIPDLERPSFFDGQQPDASDLAATFDYLRELRWLHNRTLHDWGVATGLAVRGAKGDKQITIAPGYALDCAGHDLVLASSTVLPVPPVSAAPGGGPVTYYVTVSYVADDDAAPTETRDEVCGPGGVVRRVDAPLVRFQDPAAVGDPTQVWRKGLDLVLAAIQVKNCLLAATPSAAERREARPGTQPYVAAANTKSGATSWDWFMVNNQIAGISTIVDTTAAGFSGTPVYSANVIGNRLLDASGPVIDGAVTIDDPTSTSFTLRMTLPRNLPLAGAKLNPDSIFVQATLDALETKLGWYVAWTGVGA